MVVGRGGAMILCMILYALFYVCTGEMGDGEGGEGILWHARR